MNSNIRTVYIESLSDNERKAYKIAEIQLKTSFNLEKSIGFQKFIQEKLPLSKPPEKKEIT
tara:strand:- start:1327 stop:1509 length:183 start_codon:yes stop_codon:yes gene_type:complete